MLLDTSDRRSSVTDNRNSFIIVFADQDIFSRLEGQSTPNFGRQKNSAGFLKFHRKDGHMTILPYLPLHNLYGRRVHGNGDELAAGAVRNEMEVVGAGCGQRARRFSNSAPGTRRLPFRPVPSIIPGFALP